MLLGGLVGEVLVVEVLELGANTWLTTADRGRIITGAGRSFVPRVGMGISSEEIRNDESSGDLEKLQ